MIPISPLLVIAAAHAIPCEYTIDFGAQAAPYEYKMRITCVARDQTSRYLDVMFAADTNPKDNRDDMVHFFKTNGWATRTGPGNSLIVTGTIGMNKSEVELVTVRSEGAIPVTVRWSPLVPREKK